MSTEAAFRRLDALMSRDGKTRPDEGVIAQLLPLPDPLTTTPANWWQAMQQAWAAWTDADQEDTT